MSKYILLLVASVFLTCQRGCGIKSKNSQDLQLLNSASQLETQKSSDQSLLLDEGKEENSFVQADEEEHGESHLQLTGRLDEGVKSHNKKMVVIAMQQLFGYPYDTACKIAEKLNQGMGGQTEREFLQKLLDIGSNMFVGESVTVTGDLLRDLTVLVYTLRLPHKEDVANFLLRLEEKPIHYQEPLTQASPRPRTPRGSSPSSRESRGSSPSSRKSRGSSPSSSASRARHLTLSSSFSLGEQWGHPIKDRLLGGRGREYEDCQKRVEGAIFTLASYFRIPHDAATLRVKLENADILFKQMLLIGRHEFRPRDDRKRTLKAAINQQFNTKYDK